MSDDITNPTTDTPAETVVPTVIASTEVAEAAPALDPVPSVTGTNDPAPSAETILLEIAAVRARIDTLLRIMQLTDRGI